MEELCESSGSISKKEGSSSFVSQKKSGWNGQNPEVCHSFKTKSLLVLLRRFPWLVQLCPVVDEAPGASQPLTMGAKNHHRNRILVLQTSGDFWQCLALLKGLSGMISRLLQELPSDETGLFHPRIAWCFNWSRSICENRTLYMRAVLNGQDYVLFYRSCEYLGNKKWCVWNAGPRKRAQGRGARSLLLIVCILDIFRQFVSKCYFLCRENKFRLRICKGFACTSSGLLKVIFVQQKITFGTFAENIAKPYFWHLENNK